MSVRTHDIEGLTSALVTYGLGLAGAPGSSGKESPMVFAIISSLCLVAVTTAKVMKTAAEIRQINAETRRVTAETCKDLTG